MVECQAELDKRSRRIEVRFDYHPAAVASVKEIPGRKFVPRENGGPFWTVPLDLETARQLRMIFGQHLKLGPALIAWGKSAVNKETEVLAVHGADDAELKWLPENSPKLFEFISSRSYQKADAKFMAATSAINANQPGLGKTVEVVSAVFEADMQFGPHLTVAPLTSLEVVWKYELERFLDIPVYILHGPNKASILRHIWREYEEGYAFWVVTNPETLRPQPKELLDIDWYTITLDEFHRMGLGNTKTKFFDAVTKLKAQRKWALSGTPIQGRPEKLWGALHFLYPEIFTSKWNWVGRWLTTTNNGWGNQIGGIRPGLEDAFYKSLKPYMIRRTKNEVAKDLPEKQYVDVWCDMTKEQRKQYDIFAKMAEIKIDEEQLSATNVLAEYTRLKQFANARCGIERTERFDDEGEQKDDLLKLYPTFDSGKLPQLMERLAERGILPGDEEQEGSEQVVIASQFREMVFMVHKYLESLGIPSAVIAGGVPPKKRAQIIQDFQSGKIRVALLVTTAGGVAITLDKADSVHILDETWTPDDQEQLEDRVHRVSRIHQVTVYKYRSRGTIEEYISQIIFEKDMINKMILDLRRQGLVHA